MSTNIQEGLEETVPLNDFRKLAYHLFTALKSVSESDIAFTIEQTLIRDNSFSPEAKSALIGAKEAAKKHSQRDDVRLTNISQDRMNESINKFKKLIK